MTRKITSINEMCKCPLKDCHATADIKRCTNYAPLILYHILLAKDQEGYSIRACEDCALSLLTNNYSIQDPEDL